MSQNDFTDTSPKPMYTTNVIYVLALTMPNIHRQDSVKFACGKGAGMFIIKLKTTQKTTHSDGISGKTGKKFLPITMKYCRFAKNFQK